MKYTAPFVNSIANHDVFLSAFSQYAEGPAFIRFTTSSCPGAACNGDKDYERVNLGEYEACFGNGGPPPLGTTLQMTCQNAGDIVVTFEQTEFLGTSPDCPISDPNLWRLTLSFDSVVHEDCVVTSLIEGGTDHCDNPCV